jgi:2-polyprenyl-3-methyl-5-hydroxy-6-metoxy-1,4-benzoquinol methylase
VGKSSCVLHLDQYIRGRYQRVADFTSNLSGKGGVSLPGMKEHSKAVTQSISSPVIEYVTRPTQVSMSDGYFNLGSLEHFWVRRRFEVFQKLAGELIGSARETAEIGCGHGLLQRQVELAYGREVTGFDLNENGLKHNLSQRSRVICYDVYQREEAFRARFDLIFLWDVLEHLQDEDSFLHAVGFHLAPGGKFVFNVPAGRWAFSGYDTAAGHFRRYSAQSFFAVMQRNALEVTTWTYWGLPLTPTLLFRKLWLPRESGNSRSYSTGFGKGSGVVNGLLRAASKLEVIPQRIIGTSLMAVVQQM